MMRGRFNFRSFTSFILTWTFIALAVSGVVLYIAPPGRIANWTGWQLILLRKDQWQAVHTLTAILFLAGGSLHLLKFNWRPFIAHFRKQRDVKHPFRFELLSSLAVFLLIVAGTIAQRAPFQTVMTFAASIRESWEPSNSNPPIPHMEEMELAQLSETLRVETPQLLSSLDHLGFTPAGEDERLQALAKRNGRSPDQIYMAVKTKLASAPERVPAPPPAMEEDAGQGRGRRQGFKSLAELAREYGVPPEMAVRKLAARGISAAPEDRMRDIAIHSGKRPYEVLEILREDIKK